MGIDFPRAWQIARASDIEAHHPKCSYRQTDGGILCDCDVINKHPEYLSKEFFTAKTSAENNIQARRSPVALASGRMALSLAIASILLTACIHEPLPQPVGPGGAVQSVDSGGVYFTEQGHNLWLSEGVPADLFSFTPKGWYMTSMAWHQGNSIRLKGKTP